MNISDAAFPNTIGYGWTYKHINFMQKEKSIQVKIVDEALLPNGLFCKIWEYNYGNFKDTNYVLTLQDTIYVYDKTLYGNITLGGLNPKMCYAFPLQIGKAVLNQSYSVQIIGTCTKQVNAGIFDGCQIVTNTCNYDNHFRLDTMYFKENIGMVYANLYEINDTLLHSSGKWELSSYTLF